MSRKKISCYYLSNKSSQNERILHALELLELDGFASSFARLSEEVIASHKTPLDFLELLLEKEILLKEETRIERWLRQARFRRIKTLKDFDFSFQPSIDQTLIYSLAESEFVVKGKNVIFVGPQGVGKTHLSIALGLESINHGHDVRFIRLEDLIENVTKCENDGIRLQRLLASFLRPKLLILDEIDYYTMSDDAKEFLFKLIMHRHNNRTSLIFTSNQEFYEWAVLFGKKHRAAAAMDRIIGNAEIIQIEGESYRLKDKIKKLVN